MTPNEVIASIEVAVFILMGLVVIPLFWGYPGRGSRRMSMEKALIERAG